MYFINIVEITLGGATVISIVIVISIDIMVIIMSVNIYS